MKGLPDDSHSVSWRGMMGEQPLLKGLNDAAQSHGTVASRRYIHLVRREVALRLQSCLRLKEIS